MLLAASLKKFVLYHFQSELKHYGEAETGFFADKFRV